MITFKNITADSLDVVVNKLPPYKMPAVKTEVITLEGKDGNIVQSLGYDSYILPCVITLNDLTKIDSVIAWLSGSGNLVRDNDSTKYVYASIYNEIDYNSLIKKLPTKFEFYVANPFRYLITEANTTITEPATYANTGTYFSLPLLKITGTGEVTITINTRSFTLNFDTAYIHVDSASREAYHLTTNKNRQMTGDFPYFDVGNNAISWTGTVTEIVITPRTRFL